MTAIHPLVRALRETDLRRLDRSGVARIFEPAEQAGLTPAERSLLVSTWQNHASGWSAETRSAFARRFQSAPAGPRPHLIETRGPWPEDLSARMKTVWMSNLSDPLQLSYAADMARLGAELGFQLQVSIPAGASVAGLARGLLNRTGLPLETLDRVVDVVPVRAFESVWGEDNKILAQGSDPSRPVKVLVPPTISRRSLQRAEAFTADEGYHPFRPGFQGAVAQRGEVDAAIEKAGRLGREVKRTATYLEGGNVLNGTTSEGKAYALVGRDSIVISAFHLRDRGAFSAAEIRGATDELRRLGKLEGGQVDATARRLLRAEGGPGDRIDNRWRRRAEEFLGILELTRRQAARDLDVEPDRLVVLTQPDFHIDMHLRPMAPGEVLVHHPLAAMRALEAAAQDPALAPWQLEELRAMYQNAQLEHRELGGVTDQIFAELSAAGLIAVPTPGVFEGRERLANFMNGVPGTTEAGEMYYLTNASSIAPLETVFRDFMARVGVERVEMLGAEGGGPRSLSVSERSLELAGGLDCRQVDHGGRLEPKDDLARALRGAIV